MTADLHLHTHYSDGSWAPSQLIERACRLKLRHIAITDHDTVDGINEATTLAGGRLEVIPGIEINTVLAADDGRQIDIHILGYFIDPVHKSLHAVIQRQQEARLRLVDDAVKKLNGLGFPLTEQMIKEHAGLGSIGRPHITRAIVQAGGAGSINEAYERFMNRNSADYIARHSVSPQEAIAAINECGGIASIAHPGKDKNITEIILQLKTAGLQAVEVYHRSHSLKWIKHYLKLARENGLLVTGGSDCHGPFDGYPASIGSVRIPADVVPNLKKAAAGARIQAIACESN